MAVPTTAVYFSESFPAAPDGNQLCLPQTDGAAPEQSVTFYPQLATTALNGVVKPDGTTVTIDPDGTIHAPGSSTGGGTGGGTSASGGLYVCVVPTLDPTDGTRTQWILPAPLLAGTVGFAFVNGVLLDPLTTDAEYAVQGTQLTTKYPVKSDDKLRYYYIQGTPNSESGGGGNVTPVGAVVRGSAITTNSAASITISLPAGSAAGDFALLLYGDQSGGTPSAPSGWTLEATAGAVIAQQDVWSKLLTSGDIATGNVTVGVPTSGNNTLGIVVFIGPTGGVREADLVNGGTFSTPSLITVTTSSAVQAGDTAIYFGTGNIGSTVAPTVDRGVALQSISGDGNNVGAIYGESLAAGGVQSAVYTVQHNVSSAVTIIVQQ